jgi:hypothetical protein
MNATKGFFFNTQISPYLEGKILESAPYLDNVFLQVVRI